MKWSLNIVFFREKGLLEKWVLKFQNLEQKWSIQNTVDRLGKVWEKWGLFFTEKAGGQAGEDSVTVFSETVSILNPRPFSVMGFFPPE